MGDGFLSDFIDFDGIRKTARGWTLDGTFRPIALVATIGSAIVLEVFGGLISFIRGVFAALRAPIVGATGFVTELIVSTIGPQGLFASALSASQSQLAASGIVGFGLAAAVAALTLYILNRGVSFIG
jgi:hypothetical protein